MPQFQQSIESAQPVAAVIISVALMLFAGFWVFYKTQDHFVLYI